MQRQIRVQSQKTGQNVNSESNQSTVLENRTEYRFRNGSEFDFRKQIKVRIQEKQFRVQIQKAIQNLVSKNRSSYSFRKQIQKQAGIQIQNTVQNTGSENSSQYRFKNQFRAKVQETFRTQIQKTDQSAVSGNRPENNLRERTRVQIQNRSEYRFRTDQNTDSEQI